MTDESKASSKPAPQPTALSLAQFLTETPLMELRTVRVLLDCEHGRSPTFKLPVIELHCSHCSGKRCFDPTNEEASLYGFQPDISIDCVIDYYCRNCRTTPKTYALRLRASSVTAAHAGIIKFGEIPAFGAMRPNLVKDVLDDEVEFLDRGFRAETSGLGIGAFAYYRRFVESHKNKIISQIRTVAAAQGAKQDVLDTLDRALNEISFEKAVTTVKDAIPDSMRYRGGHNPLTLLHHALSQGLHSDDDVRCLELAKDIRLLLTDLAERTVQALKNDDELGAAVNRLLNKRARAKETR